MNSVRLWSEAIAKKAILDEKSGIITQQEWHMCVGSLTGGGMFVGTIVCGLLIQSCSGIPCRWAFLRDVSMYALSVCVVWHTLESGKVTLKDVQLFLGMYLAYVTVIFCADKYHRKVTLRRLAKEGKKRRSLITRTLSQLSERQKNKNGRTDTLGDVTPSENTPLMQPLNQYGEERTEQLKCGDIEIETGVEDVPSQDQDTTSSSENNCMSTSSGNHIPLHSRLSVTDRFAMMMSNYDPASVKFDKYELSRSSCGSIEDSEMDAIMTTIHKIHPGIYRAQSETPPTAPLAEVIGNQSLQQPLESLPEQQDELSTIDDQGKARTWSLLLFSDAWDELCFRYHRFVKHCFQEETSFIEKIGIFLELPFVAIRTVSLIVHQKPLVRFFFTSYSNAISFLQVTIPVPCEEHYCRSILVRYYLYYL